MDFIDELLLESEKAEAQQRIEMSKVKADQLLMAIQVLEDKAEDLDKMVDEEIKIMEEYRQTEQERLNKRLRWLVWNLEQFMRTTGEKTVNLPHGTMKLRLGRDKVEITDLQQFLDNKVNQKFLKVIPESYQPDTQEIVKYVKRTGHIPDGINLIPAETKFYYSTLKRSNTNGKDEQ